MSMKIRLWIFLCLVLIYLTGCSAKESVMVADEVHSNMANSVEDPLTEKNPEKTYIYVYVCGKVKTPGVYRLPSDARLFDAIEMAGGVTAEGNPEMLNLAEYLRDEQTIYVPGKETEDSPGQDEQDGRININTANKEDLMGLPGIGDSKAEGILDYRKEHGKFQSIEELMDIPGIKEGVYNKIKNDIKI